MKELFESINQTKIRLFVGTIVLTVMASIGTVGLVTIHFLTPYKLDAYSISIMAVACAGVFTFFAYAVTVCCIRTETEVEWAAREGRVIRGCVPNKD